MKNATVFGLGLFVLSLWLSAGAQAQISGNAERMARGFGELIVELSSDSFKEIGRVSVRSKNAGFCAVTASFSVPLPANTTLEVTLASAAKTEGPVTQSYQNEVEVLEATSGSMTQTFEIAADTAAKYFLNGRVASGSPLFVELTRIWAVCGIGGSQGATEPDDVPTEEPGRE